jgi:hypothetical protein
MKKLAVIFFLMSVFLMSVPNTILIIMEGTSQDTFYSLLRKGRLPNFERLTDRGNTRTLSSLDNSASIYDDYRVIFSGQTNQTIACEGDDPIPNERSVFEQIDEFSPGISSGYMFSKHRALKNEESPTVSAVFSEINMTIGSVDDEVYRTSRTVATSAVKNILKLEPPFFFVFNFTNVDYMGKRYREGAELYSLAVKNCDAAIGKLIDSLEEEDLYDTTEIIVVSPFGMKAKTKHRSNESFIVSTIKIQRKGTVFDIVPSILDLYTDDERTLFLEYPGTTLFDLE